MKLLITLLFLFPLLVQAQIITTIAGNTVWGFSGDGTPATSAEIQAPYDVAVDSAGNFYISDQNNFRIRKVNTAGIITTIAGTGAVTYNGDGIAATTANVFPYGITVNNAGEVFYADAHLNRVRKINSAGIISTVAGNGTAGDIGDGSAATTAELNGPAGVAFDKTGNMYISEFGGNVIRKVTIDGIITTIAGRAGTLGFMGDGGLAVNALLGEPIGITFDNVGNLYLAENYNQRVRKIDTNGIISTIAGTGVPGYYGDGGKADTAELFYPSDVAVDRRGNVYISDQSNNSIRKINTLGILTTYAGINGVGGYLGDGVPATTAHIYDPTGLGSDKAGNIYIADTRNSVIRNVIDSSNYAPFFNIGASYNLKVCEQAATIIDTVVNVTDFTDGRTDLWSIGLSPAHGTLVVSYSTTSTGGYLLPSGITYTPVPGYTGNDSFKVNINNGIGTDSIMVQATIAPCNEAVKEIIGEKNGINIFPNPAYTYITLSSVNQIIRKITITNLIGQTVYTHAYDSEQVQVDITDQSSGIYFVRINGTEVRKFVKQ